MLGPELAVDLEPAYKKARVEEAIQQARVEEAIHQAMVKTVQAFLPPPLPDGVRVDKDDLERVIIWTGGTIIENYDSESDSDRTWPIKHDCTHVLGKHGEVLTRLTHAESTEAAMKHAQARKEKKDAGK